MEIKDYISNVWPYKVDEVYFDGVTLFKEKNIDGLIAELFARNLDGENDIAGKAAMTIQKLRQKPESKISLIERDAGKDMLNTVFYNMFSRNYSENVSVDSYIELFREPALKEIIFRQKKPSGKSFEFEGYWDERNYRLIRNKNQILLEIRTPKEYGNSFEVNNRLGIKFEMRDLLDYKPSDKINDYLEKIDEKFPYPLKGETRGGYIDDKKVGSAITRYLPDLEWLSLNLRVGGFRGGHWSAILSGLRDSGFINKDLGYFGENKYILRKLYVFNAPTGEFELKIQRDAERNDPAIVFSYGDQYTKPEFKIGGVKTYKYGDINPYLF